MRTWPKRFPFISLAASPAGYWVRSIHPVLRKKAATPSGSLARPLGHSEQMSRRLSLCKITKYSQHLPLQTTPVGNISKCGPHNDSCSHLTEGTGTNTYAQKYFWPTPFEQLWILTWKRALVVMPSCGQCTEKAIRTMSAYEVIHMK